MVNLRKKVELLLIENKLNVLSDENFSYQKKSNVDDVLCNLKQIFINCDVQLLISLRHPVDFVFSFYVQAYPYRFYWNKDLNTFEKFAQHLLNNVDSKEYLEFLFEDYLALADKHFSNINVMLFEDLINDQDDYFTTLADLLKIDKNDIKSKFLTKILNTKENASTFAGKKSRPIKFKGFRKIFKKLFGKSGVVVEHKYPDEKLSEELTQALCIKDIDKFAKQYNLDKNKLIRYHYSK